MESREGCLYPEVWVRFLKFILACSVLTNCLIFGWSSHQLQEMVLRWKTGGVASLRDGRGVDVGNVIGEVDGRSAAVMSSVLITETSTETGTKSMNVLGGSETLGITFICEHVLGALCYLMFALIPKTPSAVRSALACRV